MLALQAGPARAPGVVTINLASLVENWRRLSRLAAPARAGAVVKANGYGLGLGPVVRALQEAGCNDFFLAHVGEGLVARAALGATPDIYILNGLEWGADCDADYVAHGLAPAIGSAEELARWADAASRRGTIAPCALHLDTGMNRLGFPSLAALKKAMAQHGVASGAKLIMSHFVSAEAPDDPHNAQQFARFEEARAAFSQLPASLANSSGIFLGARPHIDLARPGYALYGGNPEPGRPSPMRAVARLAVAIQQIRWIEAGDSCGYNAQWTAMRRTRLATILAGYADGIPRAAGGVDGRPGAEVIAGGRRCPMVGRVSMDTSIVDVTDAPELGTRPGDPVELFGGEVSLDEFAARSGTIGYHVLTSLGARYRRDYFG